MFFFFKLMREIGLRLRDIHIQKSQQQKKCSFCSVFVSLLLWWCILADLNKEYKLMPNRKFHKKNCSKLLLIEIVHAKIPFIRNKKSDCESR